MPHDKDRKRIIRERMKKTGESYTAARAHIIRRDTRDETPTPAEPAPPAVDYAATAGMGDEAIAKNTGRTWDRWVHELDGHNAATLPHGEIAKLVKEQYDVADWWAQTVTVGYERIRGLRDRGQRRDGAWEASRSRTFAVPVDVLFEAWAADTLRRRWLRDVECSVRTATAPKSMRLQWPDGSVVVLWFTAKGAAKSSVAVQHTKLPDRAAVDAAKAEWGDRLDALAAMLDGGSG